MNHPTSADAIIIGGGIVGVSTAWNLARRGVKNVLILERATIAAGASGRTGAILRRHYTNRSEAMLAQLGWQIYRDWPHVVGGDCGYVPQGLIVTVDTSGADGRNADLLRRNVEFQRGLGIDARVVNRQELAELQPSGCFDDISVAAYEPESGYVDSVAATQGMARAAMREGVRIVEGASVESISETDGRVAGVQTASGEIAAPVVVCAAGSRSTRLLATTGVMLPVTALRVQVAIVQRPLALGADHFAYVDTAAGMFCRPWGPGRTLIGLGGGEQHDEVDPDHYDTRNDHEYPRRAIEAVSRRIPGMAQAGYLHGHACLYDMTPDAHPIIGPTGIDGLYVAAGFCGAGFKKGPAVGQCLADLILDGRSSSVDLTPFRLSRFERDDWRKPWSETEYTLSSDFGHGF